MGLVNFLIHKDLSGDLFGYMVMIRVSSKPTPNKISVRNYWYCVNISDIEENLFTGDDFIYVDIWI